MMVPVYSSETLFLTVTNWKINLHHHKDFKSYTFYVRFWQTQTKYSLTSLCSSQNVSINTVNRYRPDDQDVIPRKLERYLPSLTCPDWL
jgi:hypothetical protein